MSLITHLVDVRYGQTWHAQWGKTGRRFCGQQHCCNLPYYMAARFWPSLSHTVQGCINL